MFFDIIIIFIVIGIIGNILKNIGRQGEWETPNAPEKPKMPVPQRAGWQDYQPQPASSVPVEYYRTEIDDGSSNSLEGISLEAQTSDAALHVESLEVEILPHPTERQPGISLSRNSIINGIIISEILQPPKSLRRNFRY